jgi:molecular chaperone Hsp33
LYSLTYRGTRPKLITFEIVCDGPVKHAVAQVKGTRVRGYVKNPEADSEPVGGKLAVSSIVGKGILRVIRDNYVSEVPLVSGEIGEDIAYFFYQSEQRNTAVGVGVLVGEYGKVISAGGFVVEVLPDATEEEIGDVENRLKGLSVSRFLEGRDAEELFQHLGGETPAEVLEYRYDCWCTYEEVKRLVLMMEEELRGGEDKVVARCAFCRREYIINLGGGETEDDR